MDINIIKFTKINKASLYKNKFTSMYDKIDDSINNKKKYGIPLLPIIEKEAKEEPIIEPVVIKKKETDKLISFTFDDGPSIYTEAILNILNKYRSRATFFVSGNKVYQNEEIIKRIGAAGNEIGIHGYSHTPFTALDSFEVETEIAGTYGILTDIGVTPTNIVRPPYGKLNETIKDEIKSPIVLWNIEAIGNDKNAIIKRILDNIEPGSIIKMHDTDVVSVEVLEEIIPILMSKGYKLATISEMNKRYSNSLIPGRVYAKIKDYAA